MEKVDDALNLLSIFRAAIGQIMLQRSMSVRYGSILAKV